MGCYLSVIDGDGDTLGSVTIKSNILLDKCSEWSKKPGEEIFKEFEVNSNDKETDESNNEESEENSTTFSKDEFYALYRIFGRDVLIEYGFPEEKIQAWEDANL
jgi:hypothetical protein